MDPQLSLIMANQAQIRNGDLVLDPFVGTGSLLVAASQFGGYTFGTDIDFLMLHGRTRPTRISQKVSLTMTILHKIDFYEAEEKFRNSIIMNILYIILDKRKRRKYRSKYASIWDEFLLSRCCSGRFFISIVANRLTTRRYYNRSWV